MSMQAQPSALARAQGIPSVVADEIDVLARAVPLAGARVVELGCGKGELARTLVERGLVHSVIALEVDHGLHAAHIARSPPAGLTFMLGGADDIPLPDASCDLVLTMKSLHHVPITRMDRTFAEIARVLVPDGHAYISEPVYAGPFNAIVRLFHDEGEVRAAACAAIRRAVATGVMNEVAEIAFEMPVRYADFGDFVQRLVRTTPRGARLAPEELQELRGAFEPFVTAEGAQFMRPMRVNVLRRPPTR